MISWIQRSFQHHFRIIFGLLLFITIISFVFIYNPASGIGRGERTAAPQPFFGINLASEADSSRLMRDAEISVNLHAGYMGLDQAQLQQYALQRKAAVHIAEELHLSDPDSGELAGLIQSLRMFAGQDGGFDQKAYAAFKDSLRLGGGITENDVSRVLVDDWKLARVQKLLGGPGYVQAGEVKRSLLEADSTWTINVATADYATYAPDIKPTEAQLAKYFEDYGYQYDLPPQVRVTYAEFPSADFLANVTATDEEAKAAYSANPARFKPATTPADAKEIKIDPDADFAAAKPAVLTALKLEKARKLALNAASELALAIFNANLTPATLPGFLEARKVSTKPLAPFSRQAGPAEFGGSQEVAEAAFRLRPERTYSDAVASPNGAVVLFWQESLPVRKPAIAEVREKVTADYIANEKRIRFAELGRTARTQIETRLKAGDSFEQATAAAAAATGSKFEAKSYPAFTLRKPPEGLDASALGTLARLEQGKVSDMVIAKDKGYVVHAASKTPPDLTEANPKFAETRLQLANAMIQVETDSLLRNYTEAELQKGAAAVP